MSSDRIWIIDGHNVIFALGALQSLQTSERGGEARALLVERLEVFAHQRGERVLVVFDGRDAAVHPDAKEGPLIEVVYSRRAKGSADERILQEAARLSRGGALVTVVTNDMATLANALPREVRHLRVREFWLRHIETPGAVEDKPAGGDFADIEREMLALAAAVAAESRVSERRLACEPEPPKPAGTEPATARDPRRSKKERGRLRQKRRLDRQAKRG
jgi:predicted RNA-binding protein with PIN domain